MRQRKTNDALKLIRFFAVPASMNFLALELRIRNWIATSAVRYESST